MTNFEYIKSLSERELAEWLCTLIRDCNECKMKSKCNGFQMDGYRKWLEAERR